MHRTMKGIAMADATRRCAAALLASMLAVWLAAGAARAAGEIPPGARIAATCTGCHGTNGDTVGDAVPRLAGRSKEALLASLKAFKSGERPAP